MKILIIGSVMEIAGMSALLARRPDIEVVTELPKLEQRTGLLDEVIELRANPLWTPPSIKNDTPYYEHHRQRANRRKR